MRWASLFTVLLLFSVVVVAQQQGSSEPQPYWLVTETTQTIQPRGSWSQQFGLSRNTKVTVAWKVTGGDSVDFSMTTTRPSNILGQPGTPISVFGGSGGEGRQETDLGPGSYTVTFFNRSDDPITVIAGTWGMSQ